MVAYVFPGQGSQVKGMGAALFSAFPDIVAKADAILGYSAVKLCNEDPNNQLNSTQFTQPMLYLVNALTYMQKQQTENITPRFLAGHSLGEYNALLAASVFDFETGLKLVQKRGELMGQAQNGAMAAVIGLSLEKVKSVLAHPELSEISVANYNSFTQIVISGPKLAIAQAQPHFDKAGASLFMPLKVSGAFHSQYMAPAQQQFKAFIANFKLQAPKIPVIANVTAKPYASEGIADTLVQQITQSVLWTDTINYIQAQDESDIQEVGPGNVLTGLLRRIRNQQ